MLDREGNAWYSDFGQMFLGKMDVKTGKVTQYPIPIVKPGWPVGTLNLEIDKDDNPWVGVMYQSAIAKFDKKTEKFQIWQTPKEWDTDGGQLGHLAHDRRRRVVGLHRPLAPLEPGVPDRIGLELLPELHPGGPGLLVQLLRADHAQHHVLDWHVEVDRAPAQRHIEREGYNLGPIRCARATRGRPS
jgi:hypothetical protein